MFRTFTRPVSSVDPKELSLRVEAGGSFAPRKSEALQSAKRSSFATLSLLHGPATGLGKGEEKRDRRHGRTRP